MSALQPPSPRREPKTVTQLGRSRVDEYGWMKDENWQQVLRDPSVLREDVAAHLRAENAYADAVLKEIEPLRETLLREMIARIPPAEESVPVPDGPWAYYARYFEGAQHPVHARKPRTGGAEEILLDVDAEAKAHPYYALGGAAHTEDHRYYVYAEDVQGSEVYRIQVKDLASGRLCAPPVESTTGSFVVSPDSRWLFWIYRDDHGRPSRIYRRPLLGGEDVLVFDEPDAGFFLQLTLSTSRRWIVIERGDHDTNETLLIPAHAPDTPPRVAAPLVRGEKYSLAHWNDRFIVLTNTGGAVDFQLMWTPEDATRREHWQPFVPHMAGRYLLELSAGRDFLVWAERMDGNIVLRFVPRGVEGDVRAASAVIAMDEPAYDLTMLGVLEYDAPVLRYVYESPTTPAHWYDYDMASGERVLRKVREVPSGHDPQAYEVRRLFAPAADGETVPVTVLMRRGTVLDGAAPLLLYGYGSYGIPMDAGFSTSVFSLVDRGWVYAIAHIRGGSEKGWKWFLDGRGTKKVNSFTDFIASAGYLAETGYGAAGRIVAHGGSAGGVL
ncbi:S9 family peptidase, partial [Acidomonas methanolica]|uniref:S9 family peptidase n=1 Tax=Acidomonas methanolica TaxID=437 RepID=UPI00222FAB6D